MIRRAYVRACRIAATGLDRLGVDTWLSHRRSFLGRHLYSLLAIYDVERMIALGLPWWTYRATADVERLLAERNGAARVFEFGAGASTIWLADRAGEVHSVEHDAPFVDLLGRWAKEHENVDLRCVPAAPRRADSVAASERAGHEHLDFGNYVQTIHEVGGEFDLIVVDGRARSACLDAAIPHLAPDGVLVFDNADRKRYAAALAGSGLVMETRRGLAPSLPNRTTTALLRRPT